MAPAIRVMLCVLLAVAAHGGPLVRDGPTAPNCRFAHDRQYTPTALLSNDGVRARFIEDAIHWEGVFAGTDGVGLDHETGMTMDGHRLSVATGEATLEPHKFSAPSKESLHLALIAKALARGSECGGGSDCQRGADWARQFFAAAARQQSAPMSVDEYMMDVLARKAATLTAFDKEYPAFSGYLPWFVPGGGRMVPTADFADRVPSLDNGQYAWSVLTLVHALRAHAESGNGGSSVRAAELAGVFGGLLDKMAKNAVRIFYAGAGRHRTVAVISDVHASPDQAAYSTPVPCGTPCYLVDPYEGELFVMFADLLGDWSGFPAGERDAVWKEKAEWLQRAEYDAGGGQTITVQRGWWFSAHEQWKYLLAPYSRVDVAWRVFMNGERARAHFSHARGIPGMMASVTGPVTEDTVPTPYYSDCGVESISFNKVTHTDVVTPYGAFPLFIASQPHAAVWYHTMLSGDHGQTQFGSIESLNITGASVAPVVTWDSKITTVLAMVGGTGDLAWRALESVGPAQAKRFTDLITAAYSSVFCDDETAGCRLNGESFPFALPSASMPRRGQDYPNCRQPASIV